MGGGNEQEQNIDKVFCWNKKKKRKKESTFVLVDQPLNYDKCVNNDLRMIFNFIKKNSFHGVGDFQDT